MRGINRKLHSFQNPLESRIHVLQAISARCMIFFKATDNRPESYPETN